VAGFAEALKEIQGRFRERGSDGYEVAPERLEEGRLVEPCVDRFVVGELDPTRRLTASRNFLPGCPPSLAEKLGDRYNKATPQDVNGVKHAIRKALAIGYLTMCRVEGPNGHIAFCHDRPAEDLWDFWAPSCRDAPEDVGMSKEWANDIRSAGADTLIADLKSLGLTRFLGGSKLNQLGMVYAQAGVLLRIVQTDYIQQEALDEVIARVRADPNRPWQFAAYGL
jgi:hypothetical protein